MAMKEGRRPGNVAASSALGSLLAGPIGAGAFGALSGSEGSYSGTGAALGGLSGMAPGATAMNLAKLKNWGPKGRLLAALLMAGGSIGGSAAGGAFGEALG